eukprot:m.42507 g.42507  ORF g.42507 m.42507 type:complete len:277 (-) comp8331_c0_seq1:430-1260(-)
MKLSSGAARLPRGPMAPTPEEMKAAMSEPVDMERATAAQKAFVILRACLYFAAWVSLMLSVSIWHVWTPKFTAAVNMYQNDAYWQDYKSVCIITQQFSTYMNTAWNNPDGLKSLYPGTTQDRDECNFFLYSCIVGIVYAFLFFMITLCLLGNKRLKFKYLEILELSMAMLLALSCMIAASLATDGISKSCKMYSNELCESDCKYHRKSSSCEDSVKEMFAGYSDPPSELVALEPCALPCPLTIPTTARRLASQAPSEPPGLYFVVAFPCVFPHCVL